MMMKAHIENFLKLQPKLETIHGWCLPEALAAWDALLSFQESLSITGNFLEIGVWKGKTAAVMLHHLKPEKEKIFLVDIKLATTELKKNFSLIKTHADETIIYHQTPSWGLEYMNFPSTSCRFIHIDGKHTGEAVYNDLKAADKFLSHNGIVCIDDFFEHQYPQITQAVFRYIDKNPYSFSFFLCGFKKAYLARIEFVEHYLNYCFEGLSADLEARNAMITLSKTSYLADLNCFSMVPRYNELMLRGPDWDKARMEVNRSVQITQAKE